MDVLIGYFCGAAAMWSWKRLSCRWSEPYRRGVMDGIRFGAGRMFDDVVAEFGKERALVFMENTERRREEEEKEFYEKLEKEDNK